MTVYPYLQLVFMMRLSGKDVLIHLLSRFITDTCTAEEPSGKMLDASVSVLGQHDQRSDVDVSS